MADTSLAELHIARALYAGAARLASKAWPLLLDLQTKRIWLAQHKTVRAAAENIYHDAAYDAHERYDSVEEFAEVLLEDLSKHFPVEVVQGQAAFKVMPFFSEDAAFLHNLGLSALSPVKVSEFRGLDVKPFKVPVAQDIVGVSEMEVDELVAMYRRRTLKLVNLLRNLRTAMHYVESTLCGQGSASRVYANALQADEVADCVAALVRACELPFEPEPSRHFGTDSLRVNTLRNLDHEEGRALLLRAAG